MRSKLERYLGFLDDFAGATGGAGLVVDGSKAGPSVGQEVLDVLHVLLLGPKHWLVEGADFLPVFIPKRDDRSVWAGVAVGVMLKVALDELRHSTSKSGSGGVLVNPWAVIPTFILPVFLRQPAPKLTLSEVPHRRWEDAELHFAVPDVEGEVNVYLVIGETAEAL